MGPRAAIAAISVIAAFGLAAPAFAANPPPGGIGPDDGTTVYRGDPVTFTAYDSAPDNTQVWVRVSSSPDLLPYENIINDEVWFGHLSGGPSFSITWTTTGAHPAGTYYFQIYATDDLGCSPLSECYRTTPVRTLHLANARDTTPPTVNVPARITREAASGSGTNLSFTVTATDNVDGSIGASCDPPSGSAFPIGTTTVRCSATDSAGNTGTGQFEIVVEHRVGPVLSIPSGISVPVTDSTGATVQYTASAFDAVDGAIPPNCQPQSGSHFPTGTTTVSCTATDSKGNATTGSFLVMVRGASWTGSITNVHAIDGQVTATYTTQFGLCTGSGYCGWFAHAYQYPAAQSCTPDGSHLTFVGSYHASSGGETVTDAFFPAYSGAIRICLYAYHGGSNYFIAQAVYRPAYTMSGTIRNVHAVGHGRVAATYTANFHVCTGGSCAWYPHAWQLPASGPCRVEKTHLTYVGRTHASGGSETATDEFTPRSDAVRICLYVRHHATEYLIASAVYYRAATPTRPITIAVGNQRVSFYYPRGCVLLGRQIRLTVTLRTASRRGPKTYVVRVEFSLDRMKRVARRPKWQAVFRTSGFAPGSSHRASARITIKQRGRRAVIVKTLSKSFRFC